MSEYNAIYKSGSGQQIHINGLYKGAAAFLCCSGPSLLQHDLTRLQGLITLSVNNCPVTLRKHGGFSPTFWTMTDDIRNFVKSIYEDPAIIKFVPDGKPSHNLWDNNKWEKSPVKVRDCPGIIYYSRPTADQNEYFRADTFLDDTRFNWGNHAQRCRCGHFKAKDGPRECPDCGERDWWGSRSCMLVAIRILYELGFKNVFLLGCDFKMEEGKQNYAFEQDRSRGAVNNNNNTYRHLNWRFDQLQPLFQKIGFHVYNCYKESGLKSFPYISYERALEIANVVPGEDRTAGLYDRKANEKAKAKQEEKKNRMTLTEFVALKQGKLAAMMGGAL